MNIQSEKLNIIQQLLVIQDEKLLSALKNLLDFAGRNHGEVPDFYADLPFHVRKSIEISISQFEAGEGIPHSKVMTSLKKRFVK
ncbi:MAG: hypothetical protein H7246_15065 [Phycisphaerae bacterium]|nr:hypothetical protein [Saprospiraceae bacterium]